MKAKVTIETIIDSETKKVTLKFNTVINEEVVAHGIRYFSGNIDQFEELIKSVDQYAYSPLEQYSELFGC